MVRHTGSRTAEHRHPKVPVKHWLYLTLFFVFALSFRGF
jgi:hypothetical protein